MIFDTFDNGTATFEDTDTFTVTDDEGATDEYILAEGDQVEVFYIVSRVKRFLAGGIIEVCDAWWDECTERVRLRRVYTREPIGERRSGICPGPVNIVRRSKHRGRHWDRKSAKF